jgi:hypothetical protein
MKRIAQAAQDIEVYQRFEETVWQGNRRRPMWRLVREDDGRFASALESHEIPAYYNRVLKRAKRRGDFFAADDFLPPGTMPGVAAGIGPGSTVFTIADKEVEGLDGFQGDDRVAILVRGVVKPVSGVIVHGMNLQRPIASVIVPEARIVRASRGGQTVLEIKNEDLTRLQAAWAASLSRDDQQGQATGTGKRSHLLAVGLPRGAPVAPDGARLTSFHRSEPARSSSIADFDPLGEIKFVETLIGKQREMHAFPGSMGRDQPAVPFFTGQ